MARVTPLRLLGVLVVVALAVGYLAWGTVEGPDYSVPVTGTVVREELAPPGLYSMIEVDYDVGEKRYTTRLPGNRNTGSGVETFQPGDEVRLLMSEDDPARIYRPGGPSIGGGTELPAPLLALGVLIIAVVIFAPKRVDLSDWGHWLKMK